MSNDKIKELMWDGKFTLISLLCIIFTLLFLDPDFIIFTDNQFVMNMPFLILTGLMIVIFLVCSYIESKKLIKYL